MDIKGFVRAMVPFGPTGANTAQAVAGKKRTEANAATDRDADGKQSDAEEQPKRHLSPEEIQDAIKFLENLQGVKDNNLVVRLEENDGINVIYIEDPTGKTVRRLAEADLHSVLKSRNDAQSKSSGNLLNKSA